MFIPGDFAVILVVGVLTSVAGMMTVRRFIPQEKLVEKPFARRDAPHRLHPRRCSWLPSGIARQPLAG